MNKREERKARNERIQRAFSRALKMEKEPFVLKGRGYEPRTTLQSHVSRIVRDLALPFAHVSHGRGWRYYYPLRLVRKAAELMKVEPSEFTRTIDKSFRRKPVKPQDSRQIALSFLDGSEAS